MALDTRGFMDGAMQGFGLMDRHYQRQEQSERAERGLQMREEAFDMQKKQHAQQQSEAERKRDLENIQFTLGKISQGMDVSEEEIQTLEKYPRFWNALSPETDQSIEVAQAVIDPEDPMDINSPEGLAAINQMFAADINKGEGGTKRIAGVYPGPDGESLTFDLEVVGEDGQAYNAPMTQGRAPGGDDDEVMQVPLDKVIEQVQGMRLLRNTMKTPQAKQRASQVLSILTGRDGRTKGIEMNDRLVDPFTGEVMADFSEAEDSEQWSEPFEYNGGRYQRNLNTGELQEVQSPKDAGGSGAGFGLDSSHLNLVERIGRNTLGKFSPDGTFLGFPEGTQQDYLTGVSRAEELMQTGVPPIEAARIGMLSVTGTLERSQARKMAIDDAEGQDFGILDGEKRTQWIEQRTEQIMDESNTALDEYYRRTGKQRPESDTDRNTPKTDTNTQPKTNQVGLDTGGRPTQSQSDKPNGMGGGSGRVQRDGDMPTVRSDADYEALPPGTVFVDEEGNRYRKPAEQ